ncbi:formin-like protein 13 isoform X2 [Triticum urartu]|uniref:formin-like protein 13 isoform X2 n=1 Tax=Triticum urartu TaxID=4572 RepID=UPI0020443828|nr:formin-like protein 13 isoform X2 [Triticum urartu]
MPTPPCPSPDPHAAAPLHRDSRRSAPPRRPAPPRPSPETGAAAPHPWKPPPSPPSPETPIGAPPNRIHPITCALPGTPTCAVGSCGRLTPPPPATAALPVPHSGQPRTSPSKEGTKFTYCHRGNSAIPSPTSSATTVLQP